MIGVDPEERELRQQELDLRQREVLLRQGEVKSQKTTSRVQIGTTVVALFAAVAAALAAWSGTRALDFDKEKLRRETDETRLSTAVDSIGSTLPAQRVAGFTLLRRLATQRLDSVAKGGGTEVERRDALKLYRGTLDTLVTYLNQPVQDSQPASAPVELGVSDTPLARDSQYAAGEIRAMLQYRAEFLNLRRGLSGEPLPLIDLSKTYLYGLSWKGIDFAWLGSNYSRQVDLRKANLTNSEWKSSKGGPSTLSGAYLQEAILQCAQLEGANLDGAHLEGVHLEGANLQSANLEGANLQGANLQSANLEGANLDRANVAGAAFDGATIQRKALATTEHREAAVGVGERDDRKPRDRKCPRPT